MVFSKKKHNQAVELSKESAGTRKWVVAGIAIVNSSLKPISTKANNKNNNKQEDHCCEDDEGSRVKTPTLREFKIPEKLPCPPPPRKRRPAATCHNVSGAREFFNPPDLESVFMMRSF